MEPQFCAHCGYTFKPTEPLHVTVHVRFERSADEIAAEVAKRCGWNFGGQL